jgi:hypothetical protein
MNYIELIESLSITTASVVAILSILTWRKETRWKRKYELAEEVLANFHEAHQNIKNIRSPFGYLGEGQSRKRSENETKEQSEIYDNAYVVYERFGKNKEAIERLQVLKFRFIAVFGKEHEVIFNELTKIVNEIFIAASEIARIQLGEYGNMTEELGKEARENRKIIYSRPKAEDDQIELKLQKIINDIDKVCTNILGNK